MKFIDGTYNFVITDSWGSEILLPVQELCNGPRDRELKAFCYRGGYKKEAIKNGFEVCVAEYSDGSGHTEPAWGYETLEEAMSGLVGLVESDKIRPYKAASSYKKYNLSSPKMDAYLKANQDEASERRKKRKAEILKELDEINKFEVIK
jgi:hypothetical protein